MIGQNIQGKHAELRAEHDFETDSKAEKEIETILTHLENQQKLILKIIVYCCRYICYSFFRSGGQITFG